MSTPSFEQAMLSLQEAEGNLDGVNAAVDAMLLDPVKYWDTIGEVSRLVLEMDMDYPGFLSSAFQIWLDLVLHSSESESGNESTMRAHQALAVITSRTRCFLKVLEILLKVENAAIAQDQKERSDG